MRQRQNSGNRVRGDGNIVGGDGNQVYVDKRITVQRGATPDPEGGKDVLILTVVTLFILVVAVYFVMLHATMAYWASFIVAAMAFLLSATSAVTAVWEHRTRPPFRHVGPAITSAAAGVAVIWFFGPEVHDLKTLAEQTGGPKAFWCAMSDGQRPRAILHLTLIACTLVSAIVVLPQALDSMLATVFDYAWARLEPFASLWVTAGGGALALLAWVSGAYLGSAKMLLGFSQSLTRVVCS